MNEVTIQFSIVFSLIIISTYAIDTITTTQILRDNGDTLISAAGRFELGFYSYSSHNRYVGIWYNNIPERTVVWVANHQNPLTDASGVLTLIDSRLLLVQNSTSTILWSTNTSRIVQTPVATLLDSGNLVVKDADEENFLWQSFEYPTDTFLPGMKIGRTFVSGKEVHITSPKSDVDPASGDYTFSCDPTGYPQIVVKRGDAVTYRSGPWNGKGFSGAPNLQKNGIFTFEVVMSEKEVYFHFELHNESVMSRFVLSESGVGAVGRRLNWVERRQEWIRMSNVPQDSCDDYNGCGPYGSCSIKNSPACGCLKGFRPRDPQGWEGGDWSSGCIRDTPLNGEGDGFVKYAGMKLPDTRSCRHNKSMSVEECKQVCSRDCSCMAYTSLDISNGENGCLLWSGDLVDMREIDLGQDIHIRMAYNDSADIQDAVNMKHNSRGVKGGNRVILIITLSLVVMIGAVILICLVLYSRRRKEPEHQQETDRLRFNNADNQQDEIRPNKDLELPLFDLATLTKATDSFSLENKLGEGGFGAVYKARLEDGQEVAVKRLSSTSVQGVDEFKNEVMCIAELQHRNLVKLLGCCVEGEEKMLVYEYMTNRSLDLILFDPVNSMLLDWPRRSSIIHGIARGVMYLHQDSRLRVIHRDLKASNILLDSNMNPKISDFGLARTFGGDETGANTRRVIGTYGYMSPEYAVEGEFSVKSDVFSYGVLVLEIVSGKRNRWFYYRDRRLNLLGLAWMLHREEKSVELLDPCLRNSCDLWKMIRAVHVGLLCVQELPQDRPSISSVLLMLSNGGVVLPQPKHPGFFRGRALKNESCVSSNTSTSTNAVTITLPEAR